jgi:hypothetical protein
MFYILTSRATQCPTAKPISIRIQTIQVIIIHTSIERINSYNTYRKQHMALGDSVVVVVTVALQWKQVTVIGSGP